MDFPQFFEAAAANVPPQDDRNDDPRGQRPDGVQQFPAPWFIDPPGPSEEDVVTTIEIPDGAPDPDASPTAISDHEWGDSGYSTGGTDAIACYVPWHSDRLKWGIYFFDRPFFAFVSEVAALGSLPPSPLAPVVLRQVLFHELTHFRFEVVGSELEDVIGQPLYLDYLRDRFGRPAAGLSGPIEESLATWREVRFARGRLQGFLRPKPPSYLAAVMSAASAAPPGYRDWEAGASDRERERLVATVAGLIADRPIATGGWGNWLTDENKRSVPRRWVGDPRLLPNIRALEKSAPQVKVRTFERWLKMHGITPVPAKGSHRKFRYGGRSEGYGTSGGNDRLLRNDAKRLYRFFGFATLEDFLIAVGTKSRVLP